MSTTLGDPLLALLTLLLYHSRGDLSTPFCDFFRSVLPSPPFHSVGGAGSHLYPAQQDSARLSLSRTRDRGAHRLTWVTPPKGLCPPDT